jgi:hypothetical protein
MEHLFLHLIIVPLFYKEPKYVLTPISILDKLDIYEWNFCFEKSKQ